MSERCFISVDIEDPPLLSMLEGAQRSLEESGADLKSVERENLHLTMIFLGDVRERQLQILQKTVSETAFRPFKVEFRGVGAFPSLHRPRTIWVGISKGAEQLASIYEGLEPKIVELGFRLDDRGFNPHVTLARVRSGRNRERLVKLIMEGRDIEFGEIQVKYIRLKKSMLTGRGPIYSTISQSKDLSTD